MQAEPWLDEEARPRLAAKAELRADTITGRPVLLHPEGVVQLNDTAHAIVALCDGTHSLRQILCSLADEFEVTPQDLSHDVAGCLQALLKKRLILFSS